MKTEPTPGPDVSLGRPAGRGRSRGVPNRLPEPARRLDSGTALLQRTQDRTVAMNEALVLGSLRQHELAEAAERLNARLQAEIVEHKRTAEALRGTRVLLASHAGQLERLVVKRTAELTAMNKRLQTALHTTRKDKEKYRALFSDSLLMQKKLRQLAHQILSAQEDERCRISRELHDGVVQTLVGINVELSALGLAADLGPRVLQAKIGRTQRLVGKSVNAVHKFARELRPAVLDDLGLIPALHAYLKPLAARHGLPIRLTAFAGVEALPNAKRTVLYRVAQEALINVVRHAHASLVHVTIRQLPGAVRLEVQDNGKSFPVKKTLLAKTNRRLGLVGMRERVEMIGGNLTIESVSGKGTVVRAEIPFKPEKTKK